MHTMFNQGLWAASALLLFVVAFVRFSRPPTNRTGTTFLLFYTGVVFYYALLIGLWLLVIVILSGGTYGVDGIGPAFSMALKTNEWLNPSLPVVALLFIAVASQFKLVGRMDTGARQLCIQLAAIPAEAEQLAVELAHGELELKDRALIESVSNDITANISANALRFNNDGSVASRFTRAVSLYWLFIMPDNAGTPVAFPAGLSGRSAYTRIMRLNERAVEQSIALYESLMENAVAYFTSAKPTRQMEDALKKNIQALSQSVCRLIARYVLYLDLTESRRRWRLSTMGLNPRDHSPAFSLDQWVASILAIITLFMFLSLLIPGRLSFSQTFMYSVLAAIQLGIAVIAGTVVAQRFIRRQEDRAGRFPPLAELTASALVVVGLCIVLRIGWPMIQDLLTGGSMSLDKSIAQFNARWPFVTILPFVCTLSIGLISAYASLLPWGWFRLSLVGGVLNAVAFAAAGLLIGNLLTDDFLIQLQGAAGRAKLTMTGSMSIAGFVLGAIVLAIFPRSIRFSRTKATPDALGALVITDLKTAVPNPPAQPFVPDLNVAEPRRTSKDLGGYSRDSVEDLEGRYVCFRPVFSNP